MRPQGTAEELERRRRRAVELVDRGENKKDVARILGLSVRSINRFFEKRRALGQKALCAKPHPGARPKLSVFKQQQVLGWINRSPLEFGFATELWTAGRVASVIQKRFGVHYHPRYLSRWLLNRHITPQKPRRVPVERNEEAIRWWLKQVWPAIKKEPGARRPGS